MKIALVQFNPIVGAIEQNCAEMLRLYREADAEGVDLVIFPEMATVGYPIEDLALSRGFVAQADEAARQLRVKIKQSGQAGALFGCLLDQNSAEYPAAATRYEDNSSNAIAINAAMLVDPQDGNENYPQIIVKRELPNYGVFDEKRVFRTPRLDTIKPMRFRQRRLGVMVCEDCWFTTVSRRLIQQGAEILIAINGSPFEIDKDKKRIRAAEQCVDVSHIVLENRDGATIPFVYSNMVGGQDELVFDGGSFVLRGDTDTFQQMPFFEEGIFYSEVPVGYVARTDYSSVAVSQQGCGAIYNACVLGLRDYMRKQRFQSVVLGYSGGVDSGIVAAIAADAIGADNVQLVRLPSKFSSEGSLSDAREGATRLGAPMRTIPIEGIVESLRIAYTDARHHIDIKDLPEDDGIDEDMVSPAILTGVADENIQARARGNILMAISNQENHLLLTTGNKSEVSVGYSTLYGDMAGGFNPIKDCYKTTVWDMCRYRNALTNDEISQHGYLGRVGEVVPEAIIVKPPSAELRPDQKDEDSLPPYPVLDALLKLMIEDQESVIEIIDRGYDEATVRRIRLLVDRAEYKRRQSAPGVKITNKLHGRERRVPIVNYYAGG